MSLWESNRIPDADRKIARWHSLLGKPLEACKQETLMTFLNGIQKRSNRGGDAVVVWVMADKVVTNVEERRSSNRAVASYHYAKEEVETLGYVLESKLHRRRYGRRVHIQLKVRVTNVQGVASGLVVERLFKLRSYKKKRGEFKNPPKLITKG